MRARSSWHRWLAAAVGGGQQLRGVLLRHSLERGEPRLDIEHLRELLDRGRLEHVAKRQSNAEGFADPAEDTNGEQGVSAEIEEVVASADALLLQNIAPNGGEPLLGFRAGRDKRV